MKLHRSVHVILYLPALLIAASQTFKALYILVHGNLVGLYAILYGAVLWALVWRAARAWQGKLERPWLDAAVFSVIAAFWAFLVYSQFL